MKLRALAAAGVLATAVVAVPLAQRTAPAAASADPKLGAWKQEAVADVESQAVFAQQMVDQIFSYGELGFQETETTHYLIDILKKNGFEVEEGVAGIPTAFMATWGSGRPILALGSDIDCIPQASQKPGVAYHDPIIDGAPGHGEGHNSGLPLQIVAALAVKKIMAREHLPGTIRIWTGTAEELVGSKAYFIRAGLFKDADVALFVHVGENLGVSWGAASGNGLVSVQYSFLGETAHAAAAPWRGRSALDAVELMDIGWQFRREHLRLSQRSHSVITDGGDQPNVVPRTASVWYYFRETDYPHIKELWETGDTIAKAAAMMAGVDLKQEQVLGAAWPQHFNKIVAETTWANIQKIGLPKWSDDDQQLARALQKELKNPKTDGLAMKLPEKLQGPVEHNDGGGSDDIGDISWNVPTVTLRYPSNIPGLPGHNWANAIAMATPIAHKGVIAGAKVQAMTMLDLLVRKELVDQAWAYFRDVQTKDTKYEPLIRPQDRPAVWLNKSTMDKYRAEMKKFYYDPSRYKTYLDQLGIKYPTVRTSPTP
jgi:aminobenzoyl-glutamate utilization protein B